LKNVTEGVEFYGWAEEVVEESPFFGIEVDPVIFTDLIDPNLKIRRWRRFRQHPCFSEGHIADYQKNSATQTHFPKTQLR
jgi:hypothetical protein